MGAADLEDLQFALAQRACEFDTPRFQRESRRRY